MIHEPGVPGSLWCSSSPSEMWYQGHPPSSLPPHPPLQSAVAPTHGSNNSQLMDTDVHGFPVTIKMFQTLHATRGTTD